MAAKNPRLIENLLAKSGKLSQCSTYAQLDVCKVFEARQKHALGTHRFRRAGVGGNPIGVPQNARGRMLAIANKITQRKQSDFVGA
jgi:hypothetical protein